MGTVAFLNEAKEATGKSTVLVTGGAGFIGANFVLDWLAARRSAPSSIWTSSPMPAISIISRQRRRRSAACFRRRRHRRSRAGRQLLAEHRPVRDRQFRRRIACRPLDRRAGRIHCDQYRRHLDLLEAARALSGRRSSRAAQGAFRFLHVSTDEVYGSLGPTTRRSPKTTPYRAQQAVFGLEGGGRSSGARLAPHLRACRR